MPTAENNYLSGTLLASQTATLPAFVRVNTGFLPTKVRLINQTQWGATGTGNLNIQSAEWNYSNPANTNTMYINAAGTALLPGQLTSNGISQYNGAAASPYQIALGPKIAGTNTAIATGTFTISSTATLYAGATILMTQNSVNKQLGGVYFTVASVASSTTFTIANSSAWLNTSSFTNGAETFYVQLVTTPSLFYPGNAQIAYISAANPAVVTTTTNTSLTVGQQVRLYVPSAFGMTQANFTTAIVSAVSGNQVTLGGYVSLDSSAFTAFAWPDESSTPYSPAYLVPIGSGPSAASGPPVVTYNVDVLDDATTSQAFNGFTIGTSILRTSTNAVIGVTASDVISWEAWRADI